MIKMIACIDKNHVIGFEGKMPWPRLAADLAFFYKQTVNHPVVVGYNTHKVLGDLPKRENILFNRSIASIIQRAIREDVWIIGGQATYEAFFPFLDELYLTVITNKVYEGDKFFPSFSEKQFKLELLSTHNEGDIEYEIRKYTGNTRV